MSALTCHPLPNYSPSRAKQGGTGFRAQLTTPWEGPKPSHEAVPGGRAPSGRCGKNQGRPVAAIAELRPRGGRIERVAPRLFPVARDAARHDPRLTRSGQSRDRGNDHQFDPSGTDSTPKHLVFPENSQRRQWQQQGRQELRPGESRCWASHGAIRPTAAPVPQGPDPLPYKREGARSCN